MERGHNMTLGDDELKLVADLVTFLDSTITPLYKKEYLLIAEHLATEAWHASHQLGHPGAKAQVLILSAVFSSYPFMASRDSTFSEVDDFFDRYPEHRVYRQAVLEVLEQWKANKLEDEQVKLIYDVRHSIYASKLLLKVENALRQELAAEQGQEFSDVEWLEHLDTLLRKQGFYTAYGRIYSEGIEKNRERLAKQAKKRERKMDAALQQELDVDAWELKELKKKYAKIMHRAERGIETLFKLTSKNHYTLNTMVDRKANILISINAIILSIILGTLLNKIYEDPHLIVPIVMLLTTNLVSIVYAILATRPDLDHGGITDPPSPHHLLFYGNFHSMKEGQYVDGMNDLMNNADELYNSLGKDIFYLGKNLKKKFTNLRRSFNVFMYGLISSVIVFLGCHMLFEFLLAG